MNQAQRVLEEVDQVPRRRHTPLRGLTQTLKTMLGRVGQVVKQTKLRIFAGVTKSQEKVVSVFEAHTEIIRKGKASKPTEFGKLFRAGILVDRILRFINSNYGSIILRHKLIGSISSGFRQVRPYSSTLTADLLFHLTN
jgi:hypothetical protein